MPKGRTPKDWPIEQIRQWIEVDGKNHRWVGEQIGTSNQNVSKICAKHGIQAQRRGPRGGPGHPEWKGGRKQDRNGYWLVWQASHPHARSKRIHGSGYVAEHRLVMEQKLGRYLDPREVVHHIDGNPENNHPDNLELFASNGEHLRHELAGRCPKWTPEGKARILESVRSRAPKRRPEPTPAE